MVEGENDSFDTSIVPDHDEEVFMSSNPSQVSSQGGFSMGSQDSIKDFMNKADDEQVILRSPFQPTLPSARRSSREVDRTPDPEFFMPSMHVDGSRRSSGRSSRTIRPIEEEPQHSVRRRPGQRQVVSNGSPVQRRTYEKRFDRGYYDGKLPRSDSRKTLGDHVSESLPSAVYSMLAWFFGVIGMAFQFAQRPLALLLAIYFFFGGAIMVQNMVTKSIFVSLSPICRVPGVSYFELPFCPSFPDAPANGEGSESAQHVEFDDLMTVQSQFEKVLERSADGVSLPLEMKRSESSIRDLRTMVRYSDLPQRDELVYEFNEYIDTARRTAGDLQKFNTHVGSAVDSVISINRWTSRYIDTLAAASSENREGAHSLLGDWMDWLFMPFQPTAGNGVFDERVLLDKYIEHTALVSDRIAALIVEAQAVLRLLTNAEDHLSLIYDIVTRSSKSVKSRRDEILWTLWTLVGANHRRLHNLNEQLALLRQVDLQRSTAVAQVSALIIELEKIQAGLGDLRDRVAEPELTRDKAPIPLSVHIETINKGVERLEDARKRIRAAENERIREALSRGGVKEERLIEGE
jgi:hypothetical protein